MGIAYYDYEIIKGIADKSGLATAYVNSIIEKHLASYYLIKTGRSFALANKPVPEMAVFKAQSELIKELAEKDGGVLSGDALIIYCGIKNHSGFWYMPIWKPVFCVVGKRRLWENSFPMKK